MTETLNSSRHYRISQDGDLWQLDVELVPHPRGGVYHFRLTGSENEMHAAGIFARFREDIELGPLYNLTAQHIGREY